MLLSILCCYGFSSFTRILTPPAYPLKILHLLFFFISIYVMLQEMKSLVCPDFAVLWFSYTMISLYTVWMWLQEECQGETNQGVAFMTLILVNKNCHLSVLFMLLEYVELLSDWPFPNKNQSFFWWLNRYSVIFYEPIK